MKLQLTILVIILSLNVFGQQKIEANVFNWNDSIVKVGEVRLIEFEYALDGPCTVEPCDGVGGNKLMYDTLINFLTKHPSVVVQISKYVYKDHGHDEDMLLELEYEIQISMSQKGIPESRVKTKVYREDKPDVFNTQMEELEHQNNLKHRRTLCFKFVILSS